MPERQCQVRDNRPILAPLKDMARRHIASWERGRCPRVGLQPAPGRTRGWVSSTFLQMADD
jgi:hypothetical protein